MAYVYGDEPYKKAPEPLYKEPVVYKAPVYKEPVHKAPAYKPYQLPGPSEKVTNLINAKRQHYVNRDALHVGAGVGEWKLQVLLHV